MQMYISVVVDDRTEPLQGPGGPGKIDIWVDYIIKFGLIKSVNPMG